MKTLFGRKVAIDAYVLLYSLYEMGDAHHDSLRSSMSIYQFLIAVRQQDGQQLMNDAGETTSHLMGLFYRSVRCFF
jgi:flap endonuclease-1